MQCTCNVCVCESMKKKQQSPLKNGDSFTNLHVKFIRLVSNEPYAISSFC